MNFLSLTSGKFLAAGFSIVWIMTLSPAEATVYKWKDEKGKTHFTDSMSKIPLKYRTQIKKMKGMVKTAPSTPIPSPESADSNKDPKNDKFATLPPDLPAGDSKTGPTDSKFTPEQIAMLQETKEYLESENRLYRRLVKFVEPNEANGKYYIREVENGVATKKKLSRKLEAFELPSLKEARNYIHNSAVLDSGQEIGGDDYLERIQALKDRLEKGIPKKEKIIARLKEDLDKGNQ